MNDAAPPDAGAPRNPPDGSLLRTLLDEPGRFSFDAAIAVLLAASGAGRAGSTLRFGAALGLTPVHRDIQSVRQRDDGRFVVTVGFSGLTGPGGVLPRPYTELAGEEHRRRSPAMAAFMDVLSQRALLQYAQAGVKYQPHRTAALPTATARADPSDPVVHALLSLTGHGLLDDFERSGLTTGQLLYFAGLFASRPRSADRLRALVEEWLALPVKVEQFIGSWQKIEPSERSRLGASFSTLGKDAAAGSRVWDIQSRVRLVIGPIDGPGFEALLPGSERLDRLRRLVRSYLDDEAAFEINLVLRADAVPAAAFGEARLGQSAWLPVSRGRRTDAHEVVFADGARSHSELMPLPAR